MKRNLLKLQALFLALLMAFAVIIPLSAAKDSEKLSYIIVSIEDDEVTGSKPYRVKLVGESGKYLTEDTLILPEVVAIINQFYNPGDNGTPMWEFDSYAMKQIMDEGLETFREDPKNGWTEYVDKYFEDVENIYAELTGKEILRNTKSVIGDLVPNVDYKICFENEVETDAKYGVTYTVTVTRFLDIEPDETDEPIETEDPDDPVGPDVPGLEAASHKVYIYGYPDGSVQPNGNITREETAAIFYRLLTDEMRSTYKTDECEFDDVESDRWSCTEIATLAAAGIVYGRNDEEFDPAAPITRAEFAAICARFDDSDFDVTVTFPDVAGHWAENEIHEAAAHGWIIGYEDGTFRPDRPITRAEAVTLINRMLKRLPETVDDLLDDMIEFTDNMDTSAWYYIAMQEAANGHDYTRKADGKHESWISLLP